MYIYCLKYCWWNIQKVILYVSNILVSYNVRNNDWRNFEITAFETFPRWNNLFRLGDAVASPVVEREYQGIFWGHFRGSFWSLGASTDCWRCVTRFVLFPYDSSRYTSNLLCIFVIYFSFHLLSTLASGSSYSLFFMSTKWHL